MSIVTHPANEAYRDNWEETFGRKPASKSTAETVVHRITRAADVLPRRVCMDRWCDAELAIHKAVQAVEAMGADPRLTRAVLRLGHARELVADYVDVKCNT
jgi:hypothetical protein